MRLVARCVGRQFCAHRPLRPRGTLMASARLSKNIGGVKTMVRGGAVQRCLVAEIDCAAIDDTVDMVLAGEEEDA